jgi:signal transduction histidine kinase
MLTMIEGEKEIDAYTLGVYTDKKFIVNNFGSLLDTLLNEREVLNSLFSEKNKLADSNKQIVESNQQLWIDFKNQKGFIVITAHELRTPIHAIATSVGWYRKIRLDIWTILSLFQEIQIDSKLADDLSDTTRIESNNLISNKEKTDIKEAASTIIKDVKIGLDAKLNKEK